MRTKHEITEALRHIGEALTACPPEERFGSKFRMGCKTYEILAWVLKREEGKGFAELMARMESFDAPARIM